MLALTVGDFGTQVAQHLSPSNVVDASSGTHPAAWPATELIVVLSEFDVPDLFEMVESSAFAWRIPWLPVLLDHPQIRCGPLVVPGQTPCHRCFVRRRHQHSLSGVPREPAPVKGYASHHVSIAAALAMQALAALDRPAATVRTVNLIDSSMGRADVVAVDGCSRCRPVRDPVVRLSHIASILEGALNG